jgi:hypothetical protein
MANIDGSGRVGNSDEVRWKLFGLRADIQATNERLEYLRGQEKSLVDTSMTGTPSKTLTATAKNKAVKKRRVVSEETRQKMREAQRRRQEARKVNLTTGSAVPPPVGEIQVPQSTQA